MTETRIAAASGILTLLAALATTFAEYKEGVRDPNARSLSSQYLQLTDAHFESRMLAAQIEMDLSAPQGTDRLEKLIADGNALPKN
jgi:hypothetical protein